MYNLLSFCSRSVALIILALPITVSAQHGTVRYSHTRPVLSLPTDQVGELVGHEIHPTHYTMLRILLFDVGGSLMYPADEGPYVPGDTDTDGKEIGWEFIDSTLVRYDEQLFAESRKISEDIFLVEDSLPSWSWQLSPGLERDYLGYRVMKATSSTVQGDVDAWFTPEIPVPAGPGLFHGLPGIILMVTNNDTGEVYAAEEIDLTDRPRSMDPPVNGEGVTSKKYARIVEQIVAENQRTWEIVREAMINATPVDRWNW